MNRQDEISRLTKEYNCHVANGLLLKARSTDIIIKAHERQMKIADKYDCCCFQTEYCPGCSAGEHMKCVGPLRGMV